MIGATLAALALGAAPACGLPPVATGPRPWSTGEALAFDLDLLGAVRAGRMELSVGRPISAGKVIPLRARARTDGSVSTLRDITAVALSWIDARGLLPERYREEAQEDGVRKTSDAKLLPPAPELAIRHRLADRESSSRFPRQGPSLDAVSAIYYLRAAQLSPGDRFCFDVVARGWVWRVEGSVARDRERVDTPAGKLETIRLDGAARRTDRPDEAPLELHLWLSTDARRLPVAVMGTIDAGPVRAMLTEIQGARK